MQYRNKYQQIFFVIASVAVLSLSQRIYASEEWTASETPRSLPGQENIAAQTFFSSKFTKVRGEFKAQYDSMLEKRNTVNGEFLVAKFRYVFKKPIGEPGSKFSPFHDEYISEVLLDCEHNFSGTASETFLFKGKTVLTNVEAKTEILMTQMDMRGTTIDDLCKYAKKQGAW